MTVLNNLVSYVKFGMSSGDLCNDYLAYDRVGDLGRSLYAIADCNNSGAWSALAPILILIAVAIGYHIYAWRK